MSTFRFSPTEVVTEQTKTDIASLQTYNKKGIFAILELVTGFIELQKVDKLLDGITQLSSQISVPVNAVKATCRGLLIVGSRISALLTLSSSKAAWLTNWIKMMYKLTW